MYNGVRMTTDEQTLLKFPCSFPIKAMGEDTSDFEALVLSLMAPHVDETDREAIHRRSSRNGRYVSITVTVRARSRDQLDDIYRALSDHDRVLMAL